MKTAMHVLDVVSIKIENDQSSTTPTKWTEITLTDANGKEFTISVFADKGRDYPELIDKR